MTLKEAVKEFLFILNIQEESDSGRLFKPNQISSCRVMDGQRIETLLQVMETKSGFNLKENNQCQI